MDQDQFQGLRSTQIQNIIRLIKNFKHPCFRFNAIHITSTSENFRPDALDRVIIELLKYYNKINTDTLKK
jgi:hypothetical protein